jgi:hypothetical protein
MSDIQYTWAIANLERHTADGIVYTAHYTINAGDGIYTAGAYGSIGFEAPAEGDPVIPFSELTEATVIGWVKEKLGGEEKVTEIFAALESQILEQRAPSKASGLPWAG